MEYVQPYLNEGLSPKDAVANVLWTQERLERLLDIRIDELLFDQMLDKNVREPDRSKVDDHKMYLTHAQGDDDLGNPQVGTLVGHLIDDKDDIAYASWKSTFESRLVKESWAMASSILDMKTGEFAFFYSGKEVSNERTGYYAMHVTSRIRKEDRNLAALVFGAGDTVASSMKYFNKDNMFPDGSKRIAKMFVLSKSGVSNVKLAEEFNPICSFDIIPLDKKEDIPWEELSGGIYFSSTTAKECHITFEEFMRAGFKYIWPNAENDLLQKIVTHLMEKGALFWWDHGQLALLRNVDPGALFAAHVGITDWEEFKRQYNVHELWEDVFRSEDNKFESMEEVMWPLGSIQDDARILIELKEAAVSKVEEHVQGQGTAK